MTNMKLFTSESVTEGHPDKICDQISDTLLDAILEQDPTARVAIETMVTTGLVHVAGELTTTAYVEMPKLIREKIIEIGYTSSDIGFDGSSCGVSMSIGQQSPDIAQGVDQGLEFREHNSDDPFDAQGAGDQGLMFGYATDETPSYMPTAISIAHQLSEQLANVRKLALVDFLRPDGKTQVTIGYHNHFAKTIDTVVVSTQHNQFVSQADVKAAVQQFVIDPIIEKNALDAEGAKFLINPTGSFVVGGPMGDAGLTGRKIIVDTYGGFARHGGGAFSGKDPSKVDRSAAYAMRWVAKNVVAAGLAKRAEVQVAYAIGKAQPLALYVETFGTNTVDEQLIAKAIREVFDLRPKAIISALNLLRPIYAATATYGHFGRELENFTWERTDKVSDLQRAVGL
jgi:S-adenosylmethionine synthetase